MKREIINFIIRNGVIIYIFIFTIVPIGLAEIKSPAISILIDKAVSVALENNQDYKIAILKEKEVREKSNAAWGQLMPVLESEVSAMRQHAESGFMSLSDGQNEIRFVQMRLAVNPGIFYNSLKSAWDALKIVKEDTRRIKSAIEYNVIKSYFDVLLTGEIIKLQQESIDVLNTNLQDVRNMYRTGTVPKFELLQAQLELSKHEPLLLDAKRNNNVALDTFNFVLGSDKIEYIPDSSILKDETLKAPQDDTRKAEHLTAVALKNRPELIQIESKRSLAKHNKNINSAYYLWPTFSVGGYYGKTQYLPNTVQTGAPPGMGMDFSNITGTDEWQKTWQIRVAATYRWGAVLPVDQTRAGEREEKMKAKQAEEELLQLKRIIGISIRSNYSKLVTSYLTIKSQKENVNTAEEGLRIARESYRAGIIKNSELLSAELSLTNARTGYINAIYGYYVSLAELKKEMGVSDEKIVLEDATE